jgi:raffinose/stachyose/melibiose transport system substrate-binding protein
MKNRLVFLSLILLFAAAILAATGQTEKEAAELKFFTFYLNEAAPFVERFKEVVETELPGVRIEVEPYDWPNLNAIMQTRIAANEVPDIIDFKGQDATRYGAAGILMDLTDKPFMENLPAGARTGIQVKGRDYGIPYTANYQGTFYGKAIFERLGLQLPKTFAAMRANVEKLDAEGITPFATHFKDGWNLGNITMQIAMVEVFNNNPRFGYELAAGEISFAESPLYRTVFDRAKFLYDNTWSDTFSVDLTEGDKRFINGEAAMSIATSGSLNNFAIDPDFRYGIFPFPGSEPGAKLIFEPNHTFAGAGDTEHPEEVLTVFEILAVDKELGKLAADLTKRHSLIPGVELALKSPALDDIAEYTRRGEIVDVSLGNTQVPWPLQAEYSKYISDWLVGRSTLQEALRAADTFARGFYEENPLE